MRTIFIAIPVLLAGAAFGQTAGSAAGSNRDRARGFLENSLKDKNPDSRKQAVQALGLVSAQEPYLGELEAMVDD